jgi:hypothetical protein
MRRTQLYPLNPGVTDTSCHGTSQDIRPTYRYPCPEDLRKSCRCTLWLGRSGFLYHVHIAKERSSHIADITHHQSKAERVTIT